RQIFTPNTKAARIALSAVVTTAAARGEIAEVRPANVAVANAPAEPMANAASAGLPVHRKAAKNAAIVPGAKDLAAEAVHMTSAITASVGSNRRRCRRLALLCFPTIKASNRSRARFE